MRPPQSRSLLFKLLQGETPTTTEIRALVKAFEAQNEYEGQWFDLKAGALLQAKHAGNELRAAACGFANAEGGFLLIGYNESAKAFDHVAPVGGQPAEQWVTNVLGPIAHMIPPPRFATIDVGGPVLLVAVERARSLVYVIEDGAPVYYLRFGHSTKPMPSSLVTDLMLGRRAQPELRITSVGVMHADLVPSRASRSTTLIVTLLVSYENEALTYAETVRAGLVGWSTVTSDRNLGHQIRRSVDLITPPDDALTDGHYPWGAWAAQHIRSMPADGIEPFAPGQAVIERWQLPLFWRVGLRPLRFGEQRASGAPAQANGSVEMTAALYLIAKNTEPSWWQLTLRYDQGGKEQLGQRSSHHLRAEPCFYSRPVVSLRFLDEGEPVEFPQP
jgi:hypothetical protein